MFTGDRRVFVLPSFCCVLLWARRVDAKGSGSLVSSARALPGIVKRLFALCPLPRDIPFPPICMLVARLNFVRLLPYFVHDFDGTYVSSGVRLQ